MKKVYNIDMCVSSVRGKFIGGRRETVSRTTYEQIEQLIRQEG